MYQRLCYLLLLWGVSQPSAWAGTGSSAEQVSNFFLGLGQGYSDIRHSDLDDDSSYRVYGGYKSDHFWMVELGYASLGTFNSSNNRLPASLDVDNLYDISLGGYYQLPAHTGTQLEVNLGYYRGDLKVRVLSGSYSSSETGLTASARVTHNISHHIDLIFNYRYYREIQQVDFNTYQLGLRYNF